MKDKSAGMRVYLNIAKSEWDLRSYNPAHADAACDFLMFSLCLGLTYLISLNGENPPHTHEMKVLLAAVSEEHHKSDWYVTLDKWKIQTNDWYNESRYSDDFSAVDSIVEDYLSAAEGLLQEIKSRVHYESPIETKVKKILDELNSTKSVSEVIRYLPNVDLPESVLYDLVIEILQNK